MATSALKKRTAKQPRQKAAESFEEAPCSEDLALLIPAGAGTLEGFRAWSVSPEFPERGKIAFLNGEIYIDLSPERFGSHTSVKTEITRVLGNLVVEQDLGEFFTEGGRFVHVEAKVSNEPDALFIRWESYKSKQIQWNLNKTEDDSVELEGAPDFVMEIVSPSSVTKDLKTLRERYYQAGIPEYWVVDAMAEKINFHIFRMGTDGYEAVVPKAGWHASAVFGKSFKLTRKKNRVGHWTYRLEIK